MNLPAELALAVRERAGNRCQYCLMHQRLQGATFHIEHIVPRSKGGRSEPTNLALACPSCNLHKADRITGSDPVSGAVVPLFHPGKQAWGEHFRFDGFRIAGLTPTGRATATTLDFNHPRRLVIRATEKRLGL